MTATRILFGTLMAVGAFALTTSEAKAQYLPPQYFAPGYGAYYQNYPTPSGGIVNRTSVTTPFATTFTKQYYNPHTGFGFSNYSSYSHQPFGNFNSPFISPGLTPYYSSPGYGTYFVQPNQGVRIIR